MRILALDVGDVRVGVALSDSTGKVATPHSVLATKEMLGDSRKLAMIIEDYEVEKIVVGLPLSLDGTEGPQARHVRALTAKLLAQCTLPFEFFDERMSSSEAKRVMSEGNVSSRDQRGTLDKLAASVFLQSYLDAHA